MPRQICDRPIRWNEEITTLLPAKIKALCDKKTSITESDFLLVDPVQQEILKKCGVKPIVEITSNGGADWK